MLPSVVVDYSNLGLLGSVNRYDDLDAGAAKSALCSPSRGDFFRARLNEKDLPKTGENAANSIRAFTPINPIRG